jgi:hypothetical protein
MPRLTAGSARLSSILYFKAADPATGFSACSVFHSGGPPIGK